MVQSGFKSQLNLSVDMPRAGGGGSSNDGNTARAFFRNSEVSAQITGVDEHLIHRFHVILQALSCGFDINIEAYHEYALDTARMFVEKYPWYYMPTAVHKILIHGKEIISNSILPIGQLSEEAQEGCNRLFRDFRLNHARKNFRDKTMEDVFHRFLEMGDPVVSNCRQIPRKPLRSLSAEVLKLIKPPSEPVCNSITEELQIDLDETTSEESASSNAESDQEENFLY